MKLKEFKVFKWLDKRYNITPLVDYLSKKQVTIGIGRMSSFFGRMSFVDIVSHTARRHFMWYYFGGITLFLFITIVISGILLLFYYQNGEETAYESVVFIMGTVPYGWLIRSVHSWAANLMLISAFIHMFSVFFTKAYREPRELTWITGFLLLILAMGSGFSGYLLPWTKLSFFAVKIGTAMMDVMPVVGTWSLEVLRGGKEVSAATLHRFMGLHVTILPIGIIMLIGLHLLFIQRQGSSEPLGLDKEKEELKKFGGDTSVARMNFFPNFLLRDLLVWLVVLNILIILAVFFPWELGEKADPLASAPPNIKPEWFFLAMFVILELVPKELGIALFTLIGLAWFFVPFWDRKASKGKSSKFVLIFGLVITISFVALTIIGLVFTTEQISAFAHTLLQ